MTFWADKSANMTLYFHAFSVSGQHVYKNVSLLVICDADSNNINSANPQSFHYAKNFGVQQTIDYNNLMNLIQPEQLRCPIIAHNLTDVNGVEIPETDPLY